MRAVILVGGEATRLRPLTCTMPKAMVPVLNTPFLEHVIRHLSSHRVRDIILAQGRLSPPLQSYFGDGSQIGVKLSYSVEDILLGTAESVCKASLEILHELRKKRKSTHPFYWAGFVASGDWR